MFTECGVSAAEDKKLLEMDSGDGCTAMGKDQCRSTVNSEMAMMVNSILCVFTTI